MGGQFSNELHKLGLHDRVLDSCSNNGCWATCSIELTGKLANVEVMLNYYVCMLSCFFIFQEAYFICVYMYVRKYQLLLICHGVIT